MIKHLSLADLKAVAAYGAGLTVSASQFSTNDLKAVAAYLSGSAVLHVTEAQRLSAADMKAIAAAASDPAYVMFS